MKLRLFVLAFAALMTGLAAHAQTGLYFNPVVTRISNSTPDTGPFAFLGQDVTSRFFGGVDFGGYYTFAHYTKFDISVDVRDAIEHGDSASINSFLLGLRLAAKPMTYGLKPYIQVSVGAGRTESPINPRHVEKAEYDAFVGVDKAIGSHVDFRAIELGYGGVSTISSNTVGASAPLPTSKLFNISSGLVFRF